MRRAWAELRGPVSALVLLGIVARLLLPLPALAAVERAGFEAMLRAALCQPSGLPAPGEDEGERGSAPDGHCALCRLPDAAGGPPPTGAAFAAPGWTRIERCLPGARLPVAAPSARGPPPARAPPAAPPIG